MLYLLPVYRERERATGAAKGAICRVKCFSLVPRAASPACGELDFGRSRGPPPSPGHGPGQRRGLPRVFAPFGAPVARASSDLPTHGSVLPSPSRFPFPLWSRQRPSRGRTLGRKLLLTRGSGKVPSFTLDPDSGAPGLAAGGPGVLRGIWGVLSRPCPYTEPPPVPSRPFLGCQTRCGCKLMKT